MRILYVSEATGWTGGGSRLLSAARELLRRGHRVAAACPRDGELGRRLAQAGVEIYPLKIRQDYDVICAYRLARLVRQWKAEILHAQHSQAHAVALLASYFMDPLPIIVTRHVVFRMRKNPFSKFKYRSRRISRYEVVSEAVAAEIATIGIDKEKITVIPPGIDLDIWEKVRQQRNAVLPKEPMSVLMVGNYSSFKGHQVLLQAAVEVRRALPGTLFRLAGRDTEKLKPLVEKLNLGKNVELLGERSDVADLLSLAHLFVMPSLMEGFGISLIEAQSAMVPAVASAVGGLKQIIKDGETGLLVPAGNPEALAQAIIRLLTCPEEAARLAAQGYEEARRKFSHHVMVDRLENLYKEVLNEFSSRSHVPSRGSRPGDHAAGIQKSAPMA
ncbi:MAG: glycosyltransferase family 4 protein [Elusimicrobiota bacterium]